MGYPYRNAEVRTACRDFAWTLKIMISHKGITKAEAARRGGLEVKALQRWLSGSSEPHPRILRRFAEGNGFDLIKLMRCLQWMPQRSNRSH